jgi:hypothetical protein
LARFGAFYSMAAKTVGDNLKSLDTTKLAVLDASHKLSAESNQIGMTGLWGGAERLMYTTVGGFASTPKGLYHELLNVEQEPGQLIHAAVGSAAIGSLLKVALPEAGPVGKVASALMAGWFVGESLSGFGQAYKTGLHAKTWSEMQNSEQQFGDNFAQLGVTAGVGYLGYKVGAGLTGRALASESMDDFADSKQALWNKGTDFAKRVFRMDTSIPTASSVGLMPNYVVEGDRAILIDSARSAPSQEVISAIDKNADVNATLMMNLKASVLRMDRFTARKALGRAQGLSDVIA